MSASEHPTETGSGHESSKIGAGVAIQAVIAIVVLILGTFWLTSAFIGGLAKKPDSEIRERNELARTVRREPDLNPNQPAQRRALEKQQEALLETTEWIDKDAGLARVKIETAMEWLVERGIEPPKEEATPTAEGGME